MIFRQYEQVIKGTKTQTRRVLKEDDVDEDALFTVGTIVVVSKSAVFIDSEATFRVHDHKGVVRRISGDADAEPCYFVEAGIIARSYVDYKDGDWFYGEELSNYEA